MSRFSDGLDALIVARRWERRLRREGVTLAQASALDSLADGAATIGQLAKVEGVTHAVMSGVAHRLGRLGLVEEQPNPEDRRLTIVALSPDGEAMLNHLIGLGLEG